MASNHILILSDKNGDPVQHNNGLFQKKSTPLRLMGSWKFSWEGVKGSGNPGGREGGVEQKVFAGVNLTDNLSPLNI